MNEVEREMLKNAGLLHDVADELVTAIEAGEICAGSINRFYEVREEA